MRRLLAWSLAVLLAVAAGPGAQAQSAGHPGPLQRLAGARLWPARDYTRLTIEAKQALHWTLFSIEAPDRLVLDLDDVEPSAVTDGLPARVQKDDPWVRQIRVGRFRPGVLRIVLDLKAPVKASASLLEPVGDYGYRLVLDIYPAVPQDPLMSFLAENARAAAPDDAGAGKPPAAASAPAAAPAAAGSAAAPAAVESDPARVAVPPSPANPVSPAASPLAAPAAPAPAGGSLAAAPASSAAAGGWTAQGPPPGSAPPTAGPPPAALPPPAAPAAAVPTPAVPAPVAAAPVPSPADAGGERRDGRRKLAADRLITIAVDAGHGGEDPGAHGDGGTLEKDVTLAVARLIKQHIDEEPNLRAVLVRDGDYFIPLQGRTAKARAMRADLFVSVHADAYINRDARGSSVFALSERGATSVAARWLANRENQADLIGGVSIHQRDPYLAQTLFDLSQTATIQDSLRLARTVLKELGSLNPLHRGEVEQAGFAVLKSPDIPSILVETAFITNPEEERRLGDARYQDRLAVTIVRGIRRYLQAHPPVAHPRLSAAGAEP